MNDHEATLQAERDRLTSCVVVDIEIARPVWFSHRGTCWWCGCVALHVVHMRGPTRSLECGECGMGAVDLHSCVGDEEGEVGQ